MSLPGAFQALGAVLSCALTIASLGACAFVAGDPPTDEELCAKCHAQADCAVELGVATCTCQTGYQDTRGDGSMCVDIDECATNNDNCHDQAVCENTLGGFTCNCGSGYTGDGTNCFDIDECAAADWPCHENARCTNYQGDFACACKAGYQGDGYDCTDVNECMQGTHGCDANATCNNLEGSYECICGPGYSGDGFVCTDINECLLGIDACLGVTSCANLPGSYDCVCPRGYLDEYGDSSSCLLGGAGRVYLIGHDYFVSNPDNNRLLGNAVFSANTTGDVQILAYTGYADNSPGQEVGSVDSVINAHAAAIGRGYTITKFSDYTQINNLLLNKDVLLIYEQENASVANMVNVGVAWSIILNAFVDAGGTVIAMDFDGSTWQLLNRANLMTVSSTATIVSGTTLVVREPGHGIAEGVSQAYDATTGTRYYNVENAVPLVSDNLNREVVWARTQSGNCVTIDDFETGTWPNGRWWSPFGDDTGTPSLGAAHDFNWGIQDPSWHYHISSTAGEYGQRLRVWVRLTSALGSASLGFGSAAWGTYSVQLSRWVSRIAVLELPGYSAATELDTVSFFPQLNQWYQLEVQFGSGGLVTVRVYKEYDASPLATLNVTIPDLIPGGIAVRGTFGAQLDSPEICPAP